MSHVMNDPHQDVNPYESPQGVESRPQEPASTQSLAEILRTGISLYANNLLPVVLVTLNVWGPLELLQSYLGYYKLSEDDSLRLQMFLDAFVGIIAYAAVISIGIQSLRGEPVSWARAMQRGIAAWPRVFWTRLLSGFAILFGLLLFVVPGVFLAVRFSLTDCIAVNEGLSGPTCLRRSMALTQGHFWRFLALGLITVPPLMVLGYLVQLPLVYFPEIDNWITSALAGLVVDLVSPLLLLVYAAAYWAAARENSLEIPAWERRRSVTKVVIQ